MFSISSPAGSAYFTPIINAIEVAILGVQSSMTGGTASSSPEVDPAVASRDRADRRRRSRPLQQLFRPLLADMRRTML
jgi:pyruvate/2-oxoglutarate dehydrogenase complex dihydrolipoamide acyltransferase (E2) component